MKVVCESCHAKYQIPDERVAGRKLKIRCRKCGESILIHGEYITAQNPTPEAEAEVAAESSAGEWHVSVDGEQYGPYPLQQTVEMLRGHQLAWDAFVWRDGYDQWKTAGESDTLVRGVALAVSHDAETTAAPGPTSEDDSPTRMVQTSVIVDSGALPVAHRSVTQRPQAAAVQSLRTSVPGAAGSPSLRTPSTSQARSVNPTAFTPTASAAVRSPRVTPQAALTGERHEDSVLFASRNLTVDTGPVRPQTRAGYAGGEGSGLIDIRALSALARSNSVPAGPVGGNRASQAPRGPVGSEATLELRSPTGALFGSLDSLSPMARPRRSNSNALPIAIVAGSAMIAAAGILAVYITRGQSAEAGMPPAAVVATAQPIASAPEVQPQKLQAGALPAAPQAEPTSASTAAILAAVTARPSQPEPAATASALSPKSTKSDKAAKKSAKTSSRSEPTDADKPTKQAAAKSANEPKADDATQKGTSVDDLLLADKQPAVAAQPAVVAQKPAAAAGPRSIDDLLDTAVAAEAKKPAAAAAATDSALPESPSRDQVLSAMRALESDVTVCAQGAVLEEPSAKVSITVAGATGRVSSARVTGIQGTVGSCIARVVRGASFGKFSKPQFAFEFPFKLK